MAQVIALAGLLKEGRVWQGRGAPAPTSAQPTGWASLDASLPTGGWPEAALTEILFPVDGIGELQLVLPTLARLTRAGGAVLVVAPPYRPCVAGWESVGVVMRHVDVVHTSDSHDALWAIEQGLRSGSCAAVLGWPRSVDDRALRRLQVAAGTGQALGFVFREQRYLRQASPASLRLELEAMPTPRVHVRKCRGGQPPARPIALTALGR